MNEKQRSTKQQQNKKNLNITNSVKTIKSNMNILDTHIEGQNIKLNHQYPTKIPQINHIQTDMISINFFSSGYLCSTGYRANIFPQMTKFTILNAIKFISTKQKRFINLQYQIEDQNNSQKRQSIKLDKKQQQRDKINKMQQTKNSVDLVKTLPNVGESVYIYFYYTGEYFFYDHLRNELILSKQHKSQFKIVLCEEASFDKNQKIIHAGFVKQKQDFSLQIKFNKFHYQILLSDNPSLMLRKSDKNQIQLSYKNDQLTKVSISRHSFHPNNSQAKYYEGRPFRLYHLGYEKYFYYCQKSKTIKLGDSCYSLKGIFCTQKVKNNNKKSKILMIGQGKSNAYLCHGSQLQIQPSNHKKDFDSYLKQSLQITSYDNINEFLKGQLKTNYANNKKKVVGQSLTVVLRDFKTQKQKKDFMKDQRSNSNKFMIDSIINEVSEKNKFQFIVQGYRQEQTQNFQNILLKCSSITNPQNILNLQKTDENQFFMDQFSFSINRNQFSTVQSTQNHLDNLENVLRVQYIKNQMLQPFKFYLFLQSKMKILIPEYINNNGDLILQINLILSDFLQNIYAQKYFDLKDVLKQLIQLNLLSIFQKTTEFFLAFNLSSENQQHKKYISQHIKLVIQILDIFYQIDPQELLIGLIKTDLKLLLTKICISKRWLHLMKNVHLKNISEPKQTVRQCQALLQKLQQISDQDFIQFKKMIEQLQPIEDSRLNLIKSVKYCVMTHTLRILHKYQIENKYFQKEVSEVLSKSENKLSEQLLSTIQVIKTIRGNYYFNSRLMNKFYLSEVTNQNIFLTLKLEYIDYFLKSDTYSQFLMRIHFEDQQANSFIFKKNQSSQNQNSTFLQNIQTCSSIIENILPKNCRFQLYENKIIAFKTCNFLSSCQTQTHSDILALISAVIQSFKSYSYTQNQKYLFVCEGINAIYFLLNYYFQMFSMECFKNEQNLISIKKIVFKNLNQLQKSLNYREVLQKSSENKIKSGSQLLQDLSTLAWEYLNSKFKPFDKQIKNQITCFYKFLHILINLTCPTRKMFYLLKQSTYVSQYSKQFLRVIKHFKQKTYKYKIISFSQMLISFLQSANQIQFTSIINIIEKNKLMKYFVFAEQYVSQEKTFNENQFKFSNTLIQMLMKHSKQILEQDHFSTLLARHVTYNMVYAYNQISANRIMNLLLKKHQIFKKTHKSYYKIFYYFQEQILMFTQIIKQFGQIYSEDTYLFFLQFIFNRSFQDYSLNFIKFLLIFFNSLTPLLVNDFLRKYQRFFINNVKLFQKLMEKIGFNKPSQKLTQQQIQFYSLLFFMLQTFSINKSGIKNSIGMHVATEYPYNLLQKSNIPLSLKIILLKLAISNIQQIYQKNDSQINQFHEQNLKIIDLKVLWAKQSTSFVQKQIEVLKQFKKQPNFKQKIYKISHYVEYTQTLIQIIKTREEILDLYLKINDQLKSSMISNSKMIINSNEILNYRGINRLLALQMIQLIQTILEQQQPNQKLYHLIVWFEIIYKINLSNLSTNLRAPQPSIKQNFQYNYCISILDIQEMENKIFQIQKFGNQQTSENLQTKKQLKEELSLYFFDFKKIHEQLGQNLQNYIVILIQVLKRLILTVYGTDNKQNLCFEKEYQIYVILKHIQYGSKQIFLKSKERQKNKMKRIEAEAQNYQKEIQKIFQVIILLEKYKKFKYISLVHSILNHLIESDQNIHSTVQKFVLKNKFLYTQIIIEVADRFKLFSPFVKDQNQVSQFMTNFSLIQDLLYSSSTSEVDWQEGNQQLNWIAFQFFQLLQFMTNLSTSLNFQFKSFFNEERVGQKSIIFCLIQIIELSIKNLNLKSLSKLQFLALQMKFINVLMHGPMKSNIKLAIQCRYDKKIIPLIRLDQKQTEKTLPNIIAIKKIVFQTFLLMNPYMKLDENIIHSTQAQMGKCYISLKKNHPGNLDNIVQEVIRNKQSKSYSKFEKSFLYFELGLSIFYCLTKMYENNKVSTIKDLQNKKIHDRLLKKKYMKSFKMFYQIYLIVKQLFVWILGKFISFGKEKIEELQSEDSEQILYLKRSLIFYVKNTSNIQIKLKNNPQKIQFLLLKQSTVLISSIRKQMYRQIGVRRRPQRLYKFMEISKYIILRLEVEKRNKNFIQRYKPLELIIKNRQLWKSLNFGVAVFLNILFVYNPLVSFNFDNYATAIFRALGYLLCLFLFIIYFFQSLPLKIAMILQQKKTTGKVSLIACARVLMDKTLWFASIYFAIISMSILWQQGMVAMLMVDFFVRFKISRKVTEMITNPFIQLVLITLTVLSFLFVFTTTQYFFNKTISECDSISNCIQANFLIFYGINKNVFSSDLSYSFLGVLSIYLRYVSLVINLSIIIGVLIYAKNKKDQQAKTNLKQTKNTCFICDFDRSDVERLRASITGFRDHIQTQHYVWNYIYYIIYLKNKNPKDMNVIQETIFKFWKDEDWSWLPDHPCMVLQDKK